MSIINLMHPYPLHHASQLVTFISFHSSMQGAVRISIHWQGSHTMSSMREYERQLGVDASTAFMSCLCWWLQVALFLPLCHLFLCPHSGCLDIHSVGGTTVPPSSARSCCRMVATPSCPYTPTTGKPSSRMGFPLRCSLLIPYCSTHLHPEEQRGEENSRNSFQ